MNTRVDNLSKTPVINWLYDALDGLHAANTE